MNKIFRGFQLNYLNENFIRFKFGETEQETLQNVGRAPNRASQFVVNAVQDEESKDSLHAGDAVQKRKRRYTFCVNARWWKR